MSERPKDGKRDFTTNLRLLPISAAAAGLGAVCAAVAVALLKLISFFTNLFFYGRLSWVPASPADHHLGPWVIVIPAVGGLVIGLMARFGSERIRGHGIPEAMEAILVGKSRMDPKVAVLKPLSSAISIGSGGPFGAEGPIIMTGGAVGSIVAQAFHLTASERKTLLVAGAAGGMAATFATPIAAVLIAVELLLFEWKPRSLIPVALASAVAAALRPMLLGAGPIFPTAPFPSFGPVSLLACVGVGLTAGIASSLLTLAVYAAEDSFERLPFHWMWWPALGGLVVGFGGWLRPHAFGVGYDIIQNLLGPGIVPRVLLGLLIVKALIWAISLGSGTSGGVLAPLLIIGGSLGALEAPYLPGGAAPVWALIGMAAILGGTMRAPLTAIVFAVELTHQVDALLPLLVACVASFGFTVLVMKRSILTEKVARRGHHLSREYTVDPLEIVTVEQAMTRDVRTVAAEMRARDLERGPLDPTSGRSHQGYPVLDAGGKLVGVVTRSNVVARRVPAGQEGLTVRDLIDRPPVVAYPDETCRAAAERMARLEVGRLPVVDRDDADHLIGIVTRSDLLRARGTQVDQEHRRERLIEIPWTRRRADDDGNPGAGPKTA